MLYTVLTLVGLAVLGVVLYTKFHKSSGGGGGTVVVPAQGWGFQYSKNVPAVLPKDADGNPYIDFPAVDGVHYVVEAAPALAVGQVITMKFAVSGTGKLISSQDGAPAWVTLYVQRRGDDLGGVGPMQQYRYFGGSHLVAVEDAEIVLPLTGDKWGDVYGAKGSDHPDEFAACLANAVVVGFVFGNPGAGATGHGAHAVDGDVKLTLKSFDIADAPPATIAKLAHPSPISRKTRKAVHKKAKTKKRKSRR